MMIKKTLAVVAAASLVGTPVLAQAAAVQAARTSSPVGEGENIQGGWLIPALAIIAVLLGILAITSGGGDDDLPSSP
jgi:hypothetical protein